MIKNEYDQKQVFIMKKCEISFKLIIKVMKKKLAKLKNKLFGVHNSYKQLEKDNHQCISLIRNSVLPIIFLSTDGLVTNANQSFIKMVGYSHSEIINESAFLFIKTQQDSDSEKSFFADIIKRQLKGNEILEIQFCKKTGELGWVAIESLTYKRENVNCDRFIQCVLRDITREKELQAEIERLHKTNQDQATMFRNLIENTEGHIVVRKIDDTITWANNRFLETFGFSSEEVVGKTELNLWPVDVQRKISVATRVAIRNKERTTIELSIDNKGKQVAVQMTIFPIFNVFGCVEFTGVLAVDVSQLKCVEFERKKAFAEAKNSKRLLRNFIDNASTPIYALDLNNRITIANMAFANRYGLSKEELYGKNPEEFETLTGIKVNEAIPEANRQVIDERKPVNFECTTFQPVLNKITHINYAVFPLFSDDGTLSGTGTIMSDRTQTVEQVIELENTRHNADIYKLKAEYHEYLLQSYMDNVPYYASIIDLEGNFEFINKYALDLWGEAKANIMNKHYAKFIKNDRFLQYIAHDLEYAVNERKYIETEEVFSQPDKEDITFLSTTFPMFNKNGEIFAVGIFRKDITDRKHAELERERLQDDVKTQHALLSSVIDSAPDFISIKNKEHRYIMVNLGFAKALHLFPADFIGKDDLELGFPEELVKGNIEKGITGFWADNCMVMDSGQPQAIPFEPVAIDGVMHTFRTIKTPLKNVDGQVWGVLTFSHDITNELRQQEALLQS
jgi:PAS domain S-box-containing protein